MAVEVPFVDRVFESERRVRASSQPRDVIWSRVTSSVTWPDVWCCGGMERAICRWAGVRFRGVLP